MVFISSSAGGRIKNKTSRGFKNKSFFRKILSKERNKIITINSRINSLVLS